MTEDRRRFFRINDSVGVSYRCLTEQELQQNQGEISASDTISLLGSFDNQIATLMSTAKQTDPVLAELVEALNHKLDCVINQLQLESKLVQRIAHKVQQVNISACGMALLVDEPLLPGQVLSFDLWLQPSNLHVHTLGKVIDVGDSEECLLVRVDFYGMSHSDQEVLIQHIVQRQGTLLRAIREENEEES